MEEESFPCEICNRHFPKKHYLSRHRKTHIETKSFQCDICGKKFSLQKYLKPHMRTHADEKRFTCTICKKGFAFLAVLQKHTLTHTGVKSYSCELCSNSYFSQSSLRTHMKRHAPDALKTCEVCGYTTTGSLERHTVKHAAKKPFCCDLCDKGFLDKRSLKSHQKKHIDVKSYICDICGELFQYKKALDAHMRVHNRACNISGKSLDSSASEIESPEQLADISYPNQEEGVVWIKDEVASESSSCSDSSYMCHTCDKSFPDELTLIFHETSHIGERSSLNNISNKYQDDDSTLTSALGSQGSNDSVCENLELATDDNGFESSNSLEPSVCNSSSSNSLEPSAFNSSSPNSLEPCVYKSSSQNILEPIVCISISSNSLEPSVCNSSSPNRLEPNVCNSSSPNSKEHSISNSSSSNSLEPSVCNSSSNDQTTIKSNETCQDSFLCDVCAESFDSQLKLSEHLDCHSNKPTDSFKVCKKTLNKKRNLVSLEADDEGRYYLCVICSKRFRYETSLRKHHASCHPKDDYCHFS